MARRYIIEQFDDKYIATIGVKVSKKSITMEIPDGPLRLNMMIFDILGQRDFRTVRRMYLDGADGAMIVGDLTRIETIGGIETFWIPELEKIVGDIPVVLVGNKYDMSNESSEGVSLIRTIAGIIHAPNRLTSAKTGENVEGAFAALANMLMEAHQEDVKKKEPLTPIENLVHAADAIMRHFCESQDNPDVAIEICSAIYKEVGFDVEKPTKESLVNAIDLLAEQEMGDLDETTVKRNKEERLRIVNSIG